MQQAIDEAYVIGSKNGLVPLDKKKVIECLSDTYCSTTTVQEQAQAICKKFGTREREIDLEKIKKYIFSDNKGNIVLNGFPIKLFKSDIWKE